MPRKKITNETWPKQKIILFIIGWGCLIRNASARNNFIRLFFTEDDFYKAMRLIDDRITKNNSPLKRIEIHLVRAFDATEDCLET